MSYSTTYFLNDPILKQRHDSALPTEEMYRYIPPQNDIIQIDPSDPKDNIRFIFNGLPKTDFEKQKLTEFQSYENQNGRLNYPSKWLESDTMRYLQASDYDIKKAYKNIQEQISNINSRPTSISDKTIKLLNSGFMYMYGRDHHFRPIIVLELSRGVEFLNKEGISKDEIKICVNFFLDYIINYILIPGQIENWIIISDFNDIGLGDVGVGKSILSVLNSHRGRVFRHYMLNIGGFIRMAIKGLIGIFGKSSAKKLRILDKDEHNQMLELIRSDNIQQKYGGTAPNVVYDNNNLFPPNIPSQKYALDGETINVISPEEYKEMCINSNPYKPFVICPYYENLWMQEKVSNNISNVKDNIQNKKSIDTKSQISNKINKIKKYQTLNYSTNNKLSNINMNINRNNNIIQMRMREQQAKIEQQRRLNNRNNILNFLTEFKELEKLDNNNYNLIYSVPSPINTREIFNFLQNIKY